LPKLEKKCTFAVEFLIQNIMEKTLKTNTQQPNTQPNVERVSKTWLAMEYYKDNPAIKILDMRAVLR